MGVRFEGFEGSVMAKAMLNPHLVEPKYKRQNCPQFAGGHHYFPLVWHFTRRNFRRASEAEAYAKRAQARWCRLYDAAIAAMAEDLEKAEA